ncbi:MAG: hypothetical protein ACNS60_10405 [Candidatus Cyclobacteriaceae bacterium M2_1C_046]
MKTVRESIFWLKDFLQGQQVRRHYNDLKKIISDYRSPYSKSQREKFLKELFKHTTSTVPYYQNIKAEKLEDFPVVDKNIMRNNLNFLSTVFKRHNLYSTTTSGSTGTPFTIYKNPNKMKRHVAENVLFSELANYDIGTKFFYLRVWNKINKKSLLERYIQNVEVIEISNLSNEKIEKLINQIHADRSRKCLLGFSSAFEAIAKYIELYNPLVKASNINSIITMSESLSDSSRSILQNYFSCPIVSRYSNMENGFVAQQDININKKYFINHASFIVEILDLEKDIPVQEGKLGRIVITDLFNFAMPFIRYDTGDLGVVQSIKEHEERGPILMQVEGRKVDFIKNTEGELLSPHAITNTMWKYTTVLQFQFIQIDKKEYQMKLNCSEPLENENILINDLKDYLGTDAIITIEYVQEIPLLSSGKRRKIVNLMDN